MIEKNINAKCFNGKLLLDCKLAMKEKYDILIQGNILYLLLLQKAETSRRCIWPHDIGDTRLKTNYIHINKKLSTPFD